MKYFNFIVLTKKEGSVSKHSLPNKILAWIACKVLPMSNPTFDKKYADVVTWYIEYDDDKNYTSREIGTDASGNVIVKGPYKKNMGFWTDSDFTFEDYIDRFPIHYIDEVTFEKLWNVVL